MPQSNHMKGSIYFGVHSQALAQMASFQGMLFDSRAVSNFSKQFTQFDDFATLKTPVFDQIFRLVAHLFHRRQHLKI